MVLILAVAAIAAFVAGAVSASPRFSAPAPTATPVQTPSAVPSVVPGPLNGISTARNFALRRPIAVTLDNFYPDARPQAGLDAASLVYETVTEGGITRLMPVYAERDTRDVGPIRSTRPYFVSWAAGYRALFVQAGGSPAAVRLLRATRSLFGISALVPRPEFRRVSTRVAPHNLFASTNTLRLLASRDGAKGTVSYPRLPHKSPLSRDARGKVTRIRIDFSTPDVSSAPEYAVEWRFDRARDVYLRSVGGVPAIDQAVNRPVESANVAVLFTAIKPIPNDPLARVNVRTLGSGKADYFLDGKVVHGRWLKPSDTAPLRLMDSAGTAIRLNPGTTWLEVTIAGDVTWGSR